MGHFGYRVDGTRRVSQYLQHFCSEILRIADGLGPQPYVGPPRVSDRNVIYRRKRAGHVLRRDKTHDDMYLVIAQGLISCSCRRNCK